MRVSRRVKSIYVVSIESSEGSDVMNPPSFLALEQSTGGVMVLFLVPFSRPKDKGSAVLLRGQ